LVQADKVIAVVDIDESEKSTKKLTVSAWVFLMDSTGGLYVCDGLKDTATVKQHQLTFAEGERQRSGYPGYEGMNYRDYSGE
jgi:hypothetical protein